MTKDHVIDDREGSSPFFRRKAKAAAKADEDNLPGSSFFDPGGQKPFANSGQGCYNHFHADVVHW